MPLRRRSNVIGVSNPLDMRDPVVTVSTMNKNDSIPILTAAEGLQATIKALQKLADVVPAPSRQAFDASLERARRSRIALNQWAAEQRFGSDDAA